MGQVFLLALTASLNPTLVAATSVMLLESPVKLIGGYVLGALMTSITLGLVIVSSLSNSRATSTTENTASPAIGTRLSRTWPGTPASRVHRGPRILDSIRPGRVELLATR